MNCENWVFSRPHKIKDTWFKRIYWVYVSKFLSSPLRIPHSLAQCGKKDDSEALVLSLKVQQCTHKYFRGF